MASSDLKTLGDLVDAANDALFWKQASAAERESLRQKIAGHPALSGAGKKLLHITWGDAPERIAVFSGERLRTKLSTANVLGLEAYRALAVLSEPGQYREAIAPRAHSIMLKNCYATNCKVGECVLASAAFWRYLAVGMLADSEQRQAEAVKVLVQERDGQGRWQRFPFYYALLALIEMNRGIVQAELRYAAAACENMLKRSPQPGVVEERRRRILSVALAAC